MFQAIGIYRKFSQFDRKHSKICNLHILGHRHGIHDILNISYYEQC